MRTTPHFIAICPNNTNENDLNSELHKISEWLASNKLSLNALKTKFIVFHSMQRKVKYPVVTINNTIIERVMQFNFLGVILHYTLKWQKHIDGHESKPANSNFSKKILFDKFEGNTFLHNVLKNLVPSMSLYPSFRQLSKPAISHSDTFQRNKTG